MTFGFIVLMMAVSIFLTGVGLVLTLLLVRAILAYKDSK
jgi:hypothetical protein